MERTGKGEDASPSSQDLPDIVQPKIEFAESTQSLDSFSDSANNGHVDASEDFEVFTAGISNGVTGKTTSATRTPRGVFYVFIMVNLQLID